MCPNVYRDISLSDCDFCIALIITRHLQSKLMESTVTLMHKAINGRLLQGKLRTEPMIHSTGLRSMRHRRPASVDPRAGDMSKSIHFNELKTIGFFIPSLAKYHIQVIAFIAIHCIQVLWQILNRLHLMLL